MKLITTRVELVALARGLGVRPDWHEPDEQGVSARVFGQGFDNAMPPGLWMGNIEQGQEPHAEQYVVLYQAQEDAEFQTDPEPVAAVNLATLFAWATGHQD